MQAYTLALSQKESDGSTTSQQRFLNKIAGLVKNVKVFIKSVVDLFSFYLLINVISNVKKLV
jgi:hypothetical protein